MSIVRIDATRIRDSETFHDVFAEALGFPDFYGRNMNAWIDCLGYADEPSAEMMAVSVPRGGVLTLHIEGADGLARRCPEQNQDLVECAAIVNLRRVEKGEDGILALSFRTE
jgi:hypothetical protein